MLSGCKVRTYDLCRRGTEKYICITVIYWSQYKWALDNVRCDLRENYNLENIFQVVPNFSKIFKTFASFKLTLSCINLENLHHQSSVFSAWDRKKKLLWSFHSFFFPLSIIEQMHFLIPLPTQLFSLKTQFRIFVQVVDINLRYDLLQFLT